MLKSKLFHPSRGGRSDSKYGNVHIGKYDSKKERNRAAQLQFMLRAGLITDLREQVPFVLIPSQWGQKVNSKGKTVKCCIERDCRYIADFVYTLCATGELIVEDTKGFRTPDYIIKRKLMLHMHGIRIQEI